MLSLPLQNIAAIGNEIILFNRQQDGTPTIMKDEFFKSYYYEPSPTGIFRGYFGGKFNKITCKNPWEIRDKRNVKTDGESDIPYVRRYLIDKVNILKSPVRWIMFDIETKSVRIPNPLIAPDPITSVTAYDNYDKIYTQFWCEDFKTEYELISAFINYIKAKKPDLLCLDPNTEIKTPHGGKKLKDMKLGEEIISFSSKWNYINAKIKQINYSSKKTIQLQTRFGDIISSEEHIHPYPDFKNIGYKYNFIKTKRAKEFKEKEWLLIPKNYGNDYTETDLFSWLIGYYFGDGTKGKNRRLEFTDNNKILLIKIQQILHQLNIKSLIKHYHNYYILYSKSNQSVRNLVSKINYIYNHLDVFLSSLTQGQQLSLIGGLIDSDGQLSNNHLSLSMTNEYLIRWTSNILWGAGIPNKLCISSSKQSRKLLYIISIYNTKNVRKLCILHPIKNNKYINGRYSKDSIPITKYLLKLIYNWNLKKCENIKKMLWSSNESIPIEICEKILNEMKMNKLNTRQKKIIKRIQKMINMFSFGKIDEIKYGRKQKLIDIKLDSGHWFIANNILTHNCGYNAEGFDAPYIITRFPDFSEQISPIGRIKKRNGYPEGISIVDYYQLVKKVYKYKRHSLDFIYSDEFKVPQNLIKYRFNEINPIIKEKNLEDVQKMVALEEKLHLIDYFDEIRRIAKVLWDDLCHYSVAIDGLVLQTAKSKGVILPSKPDDEERLRRKEEDEIVGGYVFAKPGRYDGVSLLDVSGTYPNLITTFNLDPVNKRKEPNSQTVKIRKIYIQQNSDAIVPTVANRLINSRKQIQIELEGKTGDEYELIKKKDEAHKSLNNTLYGILLFRNSRIYDKDIADCITYLARFLIRYTKYSLRKLGYVVVSSDTDSIFVHSRDYEKIEKICNEVLIPNYLKHFGKTEGTLRFKYEGYFENVVFEAPKHYKGNFVTAKGEHKMIDKGIEIVRKDSSKFQEEFLEELYNRILKNETEQTIATWILEQIKELPNKPLRNIAFPFQISQTEYKSIPIFMRALQYTDEIIPNFSQDYHNELYYLYVKPFGKAERHSKSMRKNKETGKKELKESHTIVNKDVLVFDESIDHIKEVDYTEMIRRNILDKAEKLFDVLNWNKELIGIVKKISKRKKKND